MGKNRLTSQRKIILDYLRRVKTHPSAEVVYQEIKKKLPRISLGTVYRNLNTLKEKGEIIEIATEVKRFDGDLTTHHHFICQKCDRIFDLKASLAPEIKKRKIVGVGTVKHYQLYFSGICNSCERR